VPYLIISTVLDNVVSSSQPHADRKGLQLTRQQSDHVVHTDPALLERVLENYVSNAIRYTEEGVISIECNVQETNLVVAVADSGMGIPENECESIFEEYYQLDNPARERQKGLGLGLSIVKLIARLLDAPLNVSSNMGKGSVFSITVPLGNTDALHPPVNQRGTHETGNEKQTVLLVDDEESVIKSTARLLRMFKMNVHTAENAEEALELISSGLNPDFLVSDFRLPDCDGIDLIRRVRASLGRDLPVIIMSGDIYSEKIKNAELPKFTVLTKPVDPSRLRSLIESHLVDY